MSIEPIQTSKESPKVAHMNDAGLVGLDDPQQVSTLKFATSSTSTIQAITFCTQKMSGRPGSGLDTEKKAVAGPKFVDFIFTPTSFTHMHGFQAVCVRGPETDAKLPKICIGLFLHHLLVGEVTVVFEIGGAFSVPGDPGSATIQKGERTMKRDILEKPFDAAQIKQRIGAYGNVLDYVEGHTVIRRLNDAFDGAWCFEILQHHIRSLSFRSQSLFLCPFNILICANGMIAKTAVASRFRHVSRKALEEFPDRLRQVVYESERNQDRFAISTQTSVDDPLATIGSFNRQLNVTKKEAEAIQHAWKIEPGMTMFHVLGAYTRAAHNPGLTAEECYKLDRIGGLILSMVKE